MMPSADEVAAAVVAASREMGVSPLDVVLGAERQERLYFRTAQSISRARAYAARAIDKVFNRPEVVVPRPTIARWVGASEASAPVFFASLDGRPLSWWNDAVLRRVVDVVMERDPAGVGEKTQTDPETRPEGEESLRDQGPQGGRVLPAPSETRPAPYKYVPPYRGPDDLIRKVLEDDDADDAPVFDRGGRGERKPREAPVTKSKRQMEQDLAEAVRNTAAQTPPAEE